MELNPINEDLVSEYKKRVAENTTCKTSTVQQAVLSVIANLESGKSKLFTLGIPELDYAIGDGLGEGELMIIGARPSHGKSAIALQMSHHLTERGVPVLIVSQEMSDIALGKRTLQFLSEIPQDDWAFSTRELREEAALHFAKRSPAYILETIPNAIELCERAIKMQQEDGVRVLFVDYAQIVQGIGKSQYERVTDVSSRLRRLATETGLAIVCLAQLSREVEKRPKFEPSGKDLKDSGQLEQDADVVVFAHWPYKIDQKNDRNLYSFIVDKNRNRAIRKYGFNVHFEPERQRLLDALAIAQSEFSNDFNGYT